MVAVCVFSLRQHAFCGDYTYIHTRQRLTVTVCVRIAADNQKLMAHEDAIGSLISLLDSDMDLIQRQAAKALANLGVNAANKAQIADEGGIPKLVRLATVAQIPVKIEAIAALANLAVNGMMLASACCDGCLYGCPCLYVCAVCLRAGEDANELEIVRLGGLEPIITSMALAAEGALLPTPHVCSTLTYSITVGRSGGLAQSVKGPAAAGGARHPMRSCPEEPVRQPYGASVILSCAALTYVCSPQRPIKPPFRR